MAEQLYTIPVNDAFHADCECPLCQMQKTLEEHAIEYTMGPSYMEDDNRAMTDKMGFCSGSESFIRKRNSCKTGTFFQAVKFFRCRCIYQRTGKLLLYL